VPLAGTARTNCIEKIVAEYGTYFGIKKNDRLFNPLTKGSLPPFLFIILLYRFIMLKCGLRHFSAIKQ